jgi:hypothetical protein
MTVAGSVSSVAITNFFPYALFDSWLLSVDVPSTPTQLLAFNDPTLVVKAVDEQIFWCDTRTKRCTTNPEDARTYKYVFLCGEPDSLTPIVPGKVVNALAVRECGIDGYWDVHFIILGDGSIWEWSTGNMAHDEELSIILCGLLGALAGAISSVIISWVVRRKLTRVN